MDVALLMVAGGGAAGRLPFDAALAARRGFCSAFGIEILIRRRNSR